METGRAWSDRGVDAETREAVIAAARRSGLSLAEWLNRALDETPPETSPGTGARTEDHRTGMDAATLARLDRRLGDMERRSDAALEAMKHDLGPPGENRRGESRQSENRRGVERQSVSDMVATIARELDTTDEEARTQVEGKWPGPVAERPAATSRHERSLDEIRGRLDQLLATTAPDRPRAEARIDETLRKLEARIDAARQTLAARTVRPAAREPEPPPPRTARSTLADAIDQIAERQRDLEGVSRRVSPSGSRRPDISPSAETLDALQRDIASIGARLSAVDDQEARHQAEHALLIERLEGLAGPAPDSLGSLRDDIRAMLAEQARESGRDRQRLETLGDELNGLRQALERRGEADSLAELETQIADLRQAVEAASRSAEAAAGSPRLERLEWQINEIAGMMENVVAASSGRAGDDIARLEARVTELTAMLKTVADAGAAGAGEEMARLEARVADVASLIETAAAASAEGAARDIHRLEEQVSQLAGMVESAVTTVADAARTMKVDRIESRIEQLAEGVAAIASSSPSSEALETLRGEISAIRSDVAARPVIDPDQLEGQIGELARRIDEVTAGDPRPEMLNELEAQVAHIAAGIERNDLGGEAVARLEHRLADMQAHLANNEAHAIDAARRAAEDAVRELAASHTGDAETGRLIEDLKADLETLRAEATSPDSETEQTLASLNATIATVASRLEDLESRARSAATPPARPPAIPAPDAPGREIRLSEADPGPLAGLSPTPDDDPLAALSALAEGGSSPAPAEPVSEESGAAEPQVDEARTRRADFIAAARRAAQAAAAESRSVGREESENVEPGEARKPGAFRRISRALKGRRTSVLLAAAAIVIALGAIQMFGDIEPDRVADASSGVRPPAATPLAAPAMAPSTPQRPAAPSSGRLAGSPGGAPPPLTAPTFNALPTAPSAVFNPDPALAFAPAVDVDSRFVSPGTGAISAPTAAEVPQADRAIGPAALFDAARSGDATAAHEIATRYADGVRAPRDMAAARAWFEQAADGGLAVAQYRLGSLYERGIGGPRDLVAAADWYQRAADQGNINAMHNLAVLYSEGVNGQPDNAKALQWFTAAAEYGVTDSQYNLGVIYARGVGSGADPITAFKWFAVAAAAGDTGAVERRDQLAESLSPQDLGRARMLAQSWSRKPAIGEANAVASVWDDTSRMTATDRRTLVSNVQALLAGYGFDPGPADGLEGPRTRQAVIAFQRQTGQPTTGKIDPALVTALTRRS